MPSLGGSVSLWLGEPAHPLLFASFPPLATKEQQQEIDQQREQIAALKEQNASLEARLSALEQKTAMQSAPSQVASLDPAGSLVSGNLFGGLGLLFGVAALLTRARVRIR